MNTFSNAHEFFPDYFSSGELWHCGQDFYLIQRPKFFPLTAHVQFDWHCFLLVTKGEVNVLIDDKPIKLLPGMSIAVLDGQRISVTKASADADSVVYLLSKRLSEMIFVKKSLAFYADMHKNPVSVHNAYAMRTVMDIVALLKDILEHPHAENMLDACASLMRLYFRLIAPERLWKTQSSHSREDKRFDQIMTRFMDLLEKFYQRERAVQFYADQLCVTAKYLSFCTKHASGHTANWWINNYVLRDATQMLVYGEMSVKAIASRLHFGNQMLFGKYFNRQMGMSPSEYKKQALKKLNQ